MPTLFLHQHQFLAVASRLSGQIHGSLLNTESDDLSLGFLSNTQQIGFGLFL